MAVSSRSSRRSFFSKMNAVAQSRSPSDDLAVYELETSRIVQGVLKESFFPPPVAGGFSRLPTMAGSSADTRVALLPPVPESPGPTRVASTPLRWVLLLHSGLV